MRPNGKGKGKGTVRGQRREKEPSHPRQTRGPRDHFPFSIFPQSIVARCNNHTGCAAHTDACMRARGGGANGEKLSSEKMTTARALKKKKKKNAKFRF